MATNTAYLPATYDTGIIRGDTFREQFLFTIGGQLLELTGAVIRIQLRNRSGAVLGGFALGSGIEVQNDGTLTWSIGSTETAGYTAGQYRYDIEITTGTTVRTYLAGSFTVRNDITR